jgi:thiamine kinase-like enzyme
MTDLTESGFTPGQPSDALSIYQARQVVKQLARFHAHYWNNRHLLQTHRWLSGFNNRVEHYMGNLLAIPLMKQGLKLAGDLVPSKLHHPALHYAANRHRITQSLATDPQTLVHHDCHPGNLFWQDAQPGFLDWQLVRMGEGIGDVAYFLATALPPDCRRAYESELLNLYQASLTKRGVDEIDEKRLYQRYRAHLSYAFEAMVVTLAIGGMMERSSNMELIKRTATAISDHDSLAAVSGDV